MVHCGSIFLFVFVHVFQEVPDFTSQFSAVDSLESKPLKGLRIGLIRETLDNGVDGQVNSAIRAAASHLEELGCSINEVFIFFYFSLLFVLYFLVDLHFFPFIHSLLKKMLFCCRYHCHHSLLGCLRIIFLHHLNHLQT